MPRPARNIDVCLVIMSWHARQHPPATQKHLKQIFASANRVGVVDPHALGLLLPQSSQESLESTIRRAVMLVERLRDPLESVQVAAPPISVQIAPDVRALWQELLRIGL